VVAVSWGIARHLERRGVQRQVTALRRRRYFLPAGRMTADVTRPFAAAGVVAPGPPLL
jgi:hypothetical protein